MAATSTSIGKQVSEMLIAEWPGDNWRPFRQTRPGGMMTFNMTDGYLEAVVRGFRGGIMHRSEYTNLVQCETLDDIKLHFAATDYGDFLQSEPSPLHTTTIAQKLLDRLVSQFQYIRNCALEPLGTFLDMMTHGYMIDNIVLLITGTVNERNLKELEAKCHPLGKFVGMGAVMASTAVPDLYNHVLVDTPLAPYFSGTFQSADLTELDIEIIRNRLYKSYLEHFHDYCESLGGETAELMMELLGMDADRRVINITLNGLTTELAPEDKRKLYPNIGLLNDFSIHKKLSDAKTKEEIRAAVDTTPYREVFLAESPTKSLDDCFFEYEVKQHIKTFDTQMNYAVFYSYLKLIEQEHRNIVWIAECIAQSQRKNINNFINIFD